MQHAPVIFAGFAIQSVFYHLWSYGYHQNKLERPTGNTYDNDDYYQSNMFLRIIFHFTMFPYLPSTLYLLLIRHNKVPLRMLWGPVSTKGTINRLQQDDS